MPYHQESRSLFEPLEHISQLDERMPAIRQLFEHEMHAFTNEERFEVLHDLSKLKQFVSRFSGYEEKYDYFFNKIIGANKVDYLEANHIAPYQLTGADLVPITEHYLRQGITIYIENRVLERVDRRVHIERHAIKEMLYIQSALNEGEYAGYIYTNGAGSGRSHFEGFIIGKERIIKPIEWHAASAFTLHLEGYLAERAASTFLFPFCGLTNIPQGGNTGCGSLSISYLKNYLKDNARQLKEWTLCIPYYSQLSKVPEIRYFFFPSPHVLRYSESDRYNKILEMMLEQDDGVSRPESLISQLKKTIHQAQALGHKQVIEEAKSIVKRLPDFGTKWLSHYQRMKEKRQQMQASEHNLYLAYTSQRMNRIAQSFEQDQLNPGLLVLRAFKQQLVEPSFLKQQMSKIPFKSLKEVGYFLGKVGDDFYVDLLDVIPNGLIEDPDQFRQCCVFLTPTQIRGLTDYIKKPENFNRFVLDRSPISMHEIMSWLKCLRVPTNETVSFLKKQLTTEWLQENLNKCLMSDWLKNLYDVVPDRQVLVTFLREYISMTWIAELVPNFFISSRLRFIEPMFANSEELSVFLTTHLEQSFIQDTLLAIQDSYKIQIIIASYINLFPGEQFSSILFKRIGDSVLRHLLVRSHRWLLELLHQYASVEEIRQFLITNRDFIIKALIQSESIYPFCTHQNLQNAIQPRLDFFCPEGHQELMVLYRERFKLLLQAEQKPDDFKYKEGKLSYFVKELIEFIPESQRHIFIERIFESQDIDMILTIECIAGLFPKKRKHVSPQVTIDHDSSLAITDVSASVTALISGQSMFSTKSTSLQNVHVKRDDCAENANFTI